jgi:signal transduction histidine kinase
MCTRLAIKFLFVLLCALGLYTNSFSQLQYSFERINTENGLPTNALKGIVFDDLNRFLWVATESGILRYNGHGFQTFGDTKETSILNSRIINVVKKKDHSIFGTVEDASVFTIEKNKIKYVNTKQKVRYADEMLSYIYAPANLHTSKDKNSINLPLLKVNDNYFEVEDYRLLMYSKDTTVILQKNLDNQSIFVLADQLFIISSNGSVNKVLVGNDQNFTTKLEAVSVSGLPVLQKKSANTLFKVFQDLSNEAAYVLFDNNIYEIEFKNGAVSFILRVPNLPSQDYIRYFQFDKLTNTAYLATDNRGLIVARPQYFVRRQPFYSSTLNSASAYAQVLLPNGNIQVNSGALYGDAVDQKNGFFNKVSEPRTFITSDSLFLYTNFLGVTQYNLKSSERKLLTSNSFYNRSAFLQLGDSIYLFSNLGVGYFSKTDSVKKVFSYGAMPETYTVYDVVLYNRNAVLMATSEGLFLYHLKTNTITLFFKDPNAAHFRTLYVYNGYFLAGTYGGGVYVIHNKTIKPLPLDKNGYLKFVHCFIPSNNDVWISTNKGIIKSSFNGLIINFSNNQLKPNYKYYGKQEGIDILEMNGGCTPCAIKLNDGRISVPGIDGLIQFNPSLLPNSKIEPFVYIDKFKFDNQIVSEDFFVNKEVSQKVDNIEIILGISGMISEENIEVEYDIDNKGTWRSILVKNPFINIENPRSGRHNLTIRWKSTDTTTWNSQVLSYTIAYPWYAHPYMYFGYFLLLVLLIYLYVTIKTFIYVRRQRELEAEVTVKTKDLQTLNTYLVGRNQAKDQVIAIMNHDILTPLKYLHITAANLELKLKDTDAVKPVGQIKATTKELEYLTSNLLSWVKFDAINELDQKQLVDVHLLFESIVDFVLPFKQSDQVGIINNIPKGLVIKGWHDPMRVLFYNLIMNSIRSTNKGLIEISAISNTDVVTISIKDSGVGMSESMISYLLTGTKPKDNFVTPKYKTGNGVGYQIIRNLVKLIFAELKIVSKVGVGTEVQIVLTKL